MDLIGSDCIAGVSVGIDRKVDEKGTFEWGGVRIATWCAHGKMVSLHMDIDMAYDTLAKVRAMENRGNHICLAHDLHWTQEGPLKMRHYFDCHIIQICAYAILRLSA